MMEGTAMIECSSVPEVRRITSESNQEGICSGDKSSESADIAILVHNLPSVVIANVLSYLSCKDKLNTVAALPTWTEHLRMSAAWHWFCSNSDIAMTRQLLRQLHQMSCWCIRHYGRYFQNCVLVLQYLDLGDMGLELVEHVANHCVGLKHFRLYHPDCFTLAEHDMFERYVNLLHSAMETCRGLKHVALCNLDYLAINKRDGIKELFDRFIEDKTHVHITELEFCHAYDYSQPVACLGQFDNLRKLKCPIQVLTTPIVCQLASKSLCDIYLLNDGSTLNEDFNEAISLQWYEVAKVLPVLRVHYIIQGRSFRPENIATNPLVHTVILDSLCNPIGQDLISVIGHTYGESLRVFGHLATEWNFLPYDDIKLVTFIFRDLVTHCPKLETIATALEIPSSALLLIAANQKIKNLWVDQEKVQFDFGEMFDVMDILHQAQGEAEYVDWWETLINDMPSLKKVMSRFLRYHWRPLTSEELNEKTKQFIKF